MQIDIDIHIDTDRMCIDRDIDRDIMHIDRDIDIMPLFASSGLDEMEEERIQVQKEGQAVIEMEMRKGVEDAFVKFDEARNAAYKSIDYSNLRAQDYRVALFFLRPRPFENTYRHVDPRHSYVYVSLEDACLSK